MVVNKDIAPETITQRQKNDSISSELVAVINAWPKLPKRVRKAILVLLGVNVE